MAERTVKLEVLVGADGAQTGATAAAGALDKVGTAAEDVGKKGAEAGQQLEEGLAKVPEAAGPAVTSLESLAAAGKENVDALRALVGDGVMPALAAMDNMAQKGDAAPRALLRAAASAKIEVDKLKESLKQVGDATPAEIERAEKAIKAMETTIASAAKQAGTSAVAVKELTAQSRAMGDGAAYAAASAGSLHGMLGAMERQAGATMSTVGKLGVATIGVYEAWKLGTEIGNKVVEVLHKMGIKYEGLSPAIAKFIDWVTHGGKAVEDLGDDHEKWNVKAKSSVGIMNEQEIALNNVRDAIAKNHPEWAHLLEKEKDVTAAIPDFVKWVHEASGSHDQWTRFIANNHTALAGFGKALQDAGKDLKGEDAGLRAAIQAAKDFEAEHGKMAEAVKKSFAQIRDEYAKGTAELQQSTAKDQAALDQKFKALNQELQNEKISLDEHSAKKRELQAEQEALNEKEAASMKAAKDKEIAALQALQEKEGISNEEMQKLAATYGVASVNSKELAEKHDALAKAAENLNNPMKQVGENVEGVKVKFDSATGTFTTFQEGVKKTATVTTTANDQFKVMPSHLQAMWGPIDTTTKKLEGLAEAMDKVGKSTAGAAGALGVGVPGGGDGGAAPAMAPSH